MGALFTPSDAAGIDQDKEEAADFENLRNTDLPSNACAVDGAMSNRGTKYAGSSRRIHGLFGKEMRISESLGSPQHQIQVAAGACT